MIGVLMRIEHRVHDSNLLAEKLFSHIGRSVDEQVAAGKAKNGAATRSFISRVVAAAHRAAATDHGNAHARACAEQNHLPPDIRRQNLSIHKSIAGPHVRIHNNQNRHRCPAANRPQSETRSGKEFSPIATASIQCQLRLTEPSNRYKLFGGATLRAFRIICRARPELVSQTTRAILSAPPHRSNWSWKFLNAFGKSS